MGRGSNGMGKGFDIPWLWGNTMDRVKIPWAGGAIYQGYGGQDSMDRGVDIPWVGGSICHG